MHIVCLFSCIMAIVPFVCGEHTTDSTLPASSGKGGGSQRAVVEAYFSPKDHVDTRLISLIEKETSSIKSAVYCLTHRGIINALIEAKKRGVQVELIVDPFTVKARAPLRRMVQSGLAVHIWDPQQKQMNDHGKLRAPLMHNKFCVFSALGVVWTGSFNFTSDGVLANQENVVVIHDESQAVFFAKQFDEIKAQGCKSLRDYFSITKKKKTKEEPKAHCA